MDLGYQIAFWAFLCGVILGWVLCDLRWRRAARKLSQAVMDLNALVRKLPSRGAENPEKKTGEEAEPGGAPSPVIRQP